MSNVSTKRPKPFEYGLKSGREIAFERMMEIIEADGQEMDFSDPIPPPTPRFNALRCRVRRRYDLITATLIRIWIWNIRESFRTYMHFRFRRGLTFSSDRNALAALLREAFAKNEIKDSDLPYPPVARSVSKP